MNAISLRQPWAALLVAGKKTIEVRHWSTRKRERVLIHAATTPDEREEAWAHVPGELQSLAAQRGGFLGMGEVTACRRYNHFYQFLRDHKRHLNELDWFENPPMFGIVFENLCEIPFQRGRGQPRFFPVPKRAFVLLPDNLDERLS